MTKLVVDSSVAVKWLPLFWHERFVNEALELHRRWDAKELEISVPEFFWLEVAAIVWKAHRRGQCTAAEAGAALENLVSLNIPTIDSRPFLKLTLGIATLYKRSVYDSVYVALAHTEGAEFVTANEKLANAVSARLPVRWIGNL